MSNSFLSQSNGWIPTFHIPKKKIVWSQIYWDNAKWSYQLLADIWSRLEVEWSTKNISAGLEKKGRQN